MTPRPAKRALDAGFTLVELLIYGLLSVVVIGIIGGLLIQSLTAERLVRGITEATTAGQLAAESITSGVRNSSAFELVEPGDDQLLLARVPGSSDEISWECGAWYYSATDRSIRSTRYTHHTELAVNVEAPTAEERETWVRSWTLLASGIGAPVDGKVFSESASGLDVDFLIDAGEHRPVGIQNSVAGRMDGTETEPCF